MEAMESPADVTANDAAGESVGGSITMPVHDTPDSSALLAIAKITAPRLPVTFQRDRLFSLMDDAAERTVIWVCAPPGAGKTTLVAGWLAERGIPALWYQVDEGDGDPASFFYYMGLAARKTVPQYHSTLPLLTPEYLLGIPTFTRRYFEELFCLLKTPCTIVFDNYQEASLESPFHDVIRDGINVAPQGANIIFISRNTPPAAMTPLKAGRRLATIGWDEIRLTLAESGGVAGLYGKYDSNDKSIRHIHEMTQGWAAGVILMMEYQSSHDCGIPFDTKEDVTEVFNYFAEEIISKITPEIRAFLLKSSLLPKMTAIMAQRLTGFEGSEQILSHLVRINYFTQKHVNPEPVYQYHPLFRKFLLSQAEGTLQLAELGQLRQHAAALLEEKGDIEDALELLGEAGDWQGVCKLILGQVQSLMMQGRINFLEKWLSAIPGEIAAQSIWPLYWLGLCGMAVDPISSRGLFERAFQLFRGAGEVAGVFLAWAGGVETFLYAMDDFSHLDGWIDRIDNFRKHSPSFPSPEIEAHVAAAMTFALTWRQPHHPDIRKWGERSLALSRDISDANLRIKLYNNTVHFFCWTGEFAKCPGVLDEVRAFTQPNAVSPLFMIVWKVFEAAIFGNSVTTKEQTLLSVAEGLEIAQENGVHVLNHWLFANGVYGSLLTGNSTMAEEFLAKMATTINYNQRNAVAHLNFLQAWNHLLNGNISLSLAHAERAVELTVETGTPFPETICRIVKSLILHESAENGRAETELSAIKQLVLRTGSSYFEYLYHLTAALCYLDTRRENQGTEALRNAMALGRKKGYITSVLWWRPAGMARLCARALEEGIEVDYARELISKLDLTPEPSHTHIESWPWPVKIRALGQFSLELCGEKVKSSGKVQEKPLALLKAIIALGGKDVSEERLYDLLWPAVDGDAAYRSCATNLHRLRKLLGQDQALLVQSGKVTLNPAVVWVDALAFDGLTRENGYPGWPQGLLEKALALYRGHFLAGDNVAHWAVSLRERLRSKFIRIVAEMGARREEAAMWEMAIVCYQNGLEIDDLIEEFYQRLMICHARLDNRGNVISLYQRCQKVLALLGLKPSAVTRAIYAEATADPAI